MSAPLIEFARLVDVPLDAVVDLLSEPRNTRHMPLSSTFTRDSALEWVAGKDGQVGHVRKANRRPPGAAVDRRW